MLQSKPENYVNIRGAGRSLDGIWKVLSEVHEVKRVIRFHKGLRDFCRVNFEFKTPELPDFFRQLHGEAAPERPSEKPHTFPMKFINFRYSWTFPKALNPKAQSPTP